MKKGELVSVKFGRGLRFGIIVSTELFNSRIHRLYFVPADERYKRHELEVQVTINSKIYTFQPENIISLKDSMPTISAGMAPAAVTEEICKRIRLIMDLG